MTYLTTHPGALIWTGICLAAAFAAGLAWVYALAALRANRQRAWRRQVTANVQAVRPTTPAPVVPDLPETGADENWSPLATIGAQDVSPALMTPTERIDALRSGTPLPVDLDGEAFERDLFARFDALIDGQVGQLPDAERLAFEQFRLRVRVRGLRPEDTGQLDLAAIGQLIGAGA
jgi:hypothetical protein